MSPTASAVGYYRMSLRDKERRWLPLDAEKSTFFGVSHLGSPAILGVTRFGETGSLTSQVPFPPPFGANPFTNPIAN